VKDSLNPYVGPQRTVFRNGWQRGLKELQKRMEHLDRYSYTAVEPDYGDGFEACLTQVQYMIDEIMREA
jgi:hypothetical protein